MIGSSAAGPFFEVVFALLVTELAIIGMLCVPVPGGLLRPVVRWVSTSSMLASLAKPLMWFGTLVGLSFLFTTREMLKLQEEYHDAKEYHDLGQKLQHESRMFRAQRNFYLTGFCLVLLVVIGRVYTLLKQVNKLEATSEALRKQAEGASAAYKAMSAQAEEAKLAAEAAKPASAPKAEGKVEAQGAHGGEGADQALQKRLAEAEAGRDAALRGAEALKKQAEGLSTEYARLQQEKESLENKLADFDLVMGAEVKKSK